MSFRVGESVVVFEGDGEVWEVKESLGGMTRVKSLKDGSMRTFLDERLETLDEARIRRSGAAFPYQPTFTVRFKGVYQAPQMVSLKILKQRDPAPGSGFTLGHEVAQALGLASDEKSSQPTSAPRTETLEMAASEYAVGDEVEVVSGTYRGHRGVVAHQPSGDYTVTVRMPESMCCKGLAKNCEHLFTFTQNREVMPVRKGPKEIRCSLPGCGKPNDIGVKICWGCGSRL